MKLILRLLLIVAALYVLFWGSLAAYFSYAESHRDLLESNLSGVFERQVTIKDVRTVWRGFSPRVQIIGLRVEGDTPEQPALAFESLSAVVNPVSLLRLWPRFTEFAVDQPVLEIVSLTDNELQIAGIRLNRNSDGPRNPERLLRWILDQKGAAWHNGEVVWRRSAEETRRYKDISFVYKRDQQTRTVQARVTTRRGPLAFVARTQGDILSDDLWDASLDVLGDRGQRLLTSEDLSLNVEDGEGQLTLKTMQVDRIRDFIRLSGLSEQARWLLDSELRGRLYDVKFNFSGPLLDFDSWSLYASASDVGFNSTGTVPGLDRLAGDLQASAEGGVFRFHTKGSEFEWAQMFDRSFPIEHASGEFAWEIAPNGTITVSLFNGEFVDQNATISNISASCSIDRQARTVSSLGELFTLDSVADLSFEDGVIVNDADPKNMRPLSMNATAEFEFRDLSQFVNYLPNDERIDKFREWSLNAFKQGAITNGKASYRGEVSRNAIQVGKALLDASADFDNVVVDYGYQRDWPPAERGRGSATIRNELLTISPQEIWLNGDPVTDGELQIMRLFQTSRELAVRGKTSTSLIKGMDFLFKGPLIKPEDQLEQLPITAKAGRVEIETSVSIPLSDVSQAKVTGTAEVRDGVAVLPEGVPLTKLNGDVQFTQDSVKSDNIRASFLGGVTRGRLETVKKAQPPVMKLSANGVAHASALEPWVGEHMLTWFEGAAPWQGSVLIDGAKVEINGVSNLEGLSISAPAPLAKSSDSNARMQLSMTTGGREVPTELQIAYEDDVRVVFKANPSSADSQTVPSLFDNSLIGIGVTADEPVRPGVNFKINKPLLNLDNWLSAVIDLASYEPRKPSENTAFLDAMRSVSIRADDPIFLGRPFGKFRAELTTDDGLIWNGTLAGDNISGVMQLEPRADIGQYFMGLDYLYLVEEPDNDAPPEPIDYSLDTQSYPAVTLEVDTLKVSGRNLGQLRFKGKPNGRFWNVEELSLHHNGVKTTATGQWQSSKQVGSITALSFKTDIDEAEGALTDMDFNGIIRKGKGSLEGNINWIGAPHEFDYSRLNGEFDLSLKDGELVKVEPGSGKLLGLLNFNAIARRLVFDFSDVFASGLKFDRMRYNGVFADGEAIFRDAFIFTPAVFVRMEGKIDLDQELVDLEVHISPELGGNLTLLSALANPTAGAVVFLTQRIFKDEMRESSFKSYRALGTWEDFEMVEIKKGSDDAVALMESDPAPVAVADPASDAGAEISISLDSSNTQAQTPSANKEPSADQETSADDKPPANEERLQLTPEEPDTPSMDND